MSTKPWVDREAATETVDELVSHLSGSRDPIRVSRILAKALRKKMASGDEHARRMFERHHPRFDRVERNPKLADAQLVAARMQGYRSWSQLKHHHERLERCRREIDEGAPAPDGDRSTVHVRCGSDIETGLQRAGYVGQFLEFSDPYCQGPVPPGDRDVLIETRAGFIAHAYELDLAQTRDRLRAAWEVLDDARRFDRVVLWFEHDSYDQLILAAVLAALGRIGHAGVELICVDAYPGRTRFAGLGELEEASLRGLWAQRRSVTPEDFALGGAVWAALRRPDPDGLFEHVVAGTPSIPPMAAALRRHLMELPGVVDGLSLTQRIVLDLIRAGADRVGAVFRALGVDPLPFLGDTMFWWEVRELAAGDAVRLHPTQDAWPHWGVELTPLGEALLRGEADWIGEAGRTRWVGGIRCDRGGQWRWDSDRGAPTHRR